MKLIEGQGRSTTSIGVMPVLLTLSFIRKLGADGEPITRDRSASVY